MTKYDPQLAKLDMRFFIDRPQPDESLSSVIERAAAFYHMEPGELGVSLLGPEAWTKNPGRDWDNPGIAVVSALGSAFDMCMVELQKHCITDGPAVLRPGQRRSYCPSCIEEDRLAGKSPYFRRSWARVYMTICSKHRCPLLEWGPPGLRAGTGRDRRRAVPAEWQTAERADLPLSSRVASARKEYFNETFRPYEPMRCRFTRTESMELAESLCNWEMAIQMAVEAGGRLDISPIPYLRTVGGLMALLASPGSSGSEMLGRGRELVVEEGRWRLKLNGPTQKTARVHTGGLLGDINFISSPSARRSITCLTACTVEMGWPVDEFLGTPGLESGTSDWICALMAGLSSDAEKQRFRDILGSLNMGHWPERRPPKHLCANFDQVPATASARAQVAGKPSLGPEGVDLQ